MARRNNVTQFYNGSAAYDLYAADLYQSNAAPQIQSPGLPEEKRLPQHHKRVKAKAAVAPFAILGLMVVACMLILVVFGYVQLYEATERVSSLKSELSSLQQEQVILESLYESSIEREVNSSLRAGGLSKDERAERVRCWLEKLGFDAEKYSGISPLCLSDGEKQRGRSWDLCGGTFRTQSIGSVPEGAWKSTGGSACSDRRRYDRGDHKGRREL